MSSRTSLNRSPSKLLSLAVQLFVLASPSAAQSQSRSQSAPLSSDDLAFFTAREIGPAVTGGRVHDVEALPDDPSTIYVASASGGLWKTSNRGHTWKNISDGWFNVSTFGDVAIAPSNPDIVYAGTGEQQNRQSTSWGDGIYRSDDGGDTWTHLGLEQTLHIGRVRVHPTDPDIVYVAAQGNLWAGSEERGVYRSTDGGQHWEHVLKIDEFTGAVDLVIDADNPNILYAAMYARQRRTWGFNGGSESGGIFKTTDGGNTWSELSNGIPAGATGRIGIAISASNPRVLNALIEHEDREATGTYRSTDGGESWDRVNELDPRPMYYSHIYIDPTDENVVYVMSTSSYKSTDGGRNFEVIAPRPTYDVGVHADHHTIWVDPSDPEHLYLAGDAGINESYDGGTSFRRMNNFGIGQVYAIGVDMREPYYVYGGMQDNHSWMAPSETRRWVGIVNDDWQQTGFSDGMFQRPDPTNPRYVYAGSNGGNYYRLDALTGDMRDMRPQPPTGERYRWDWASPILLSPHDPSTVYLGGNRLFISQDRGESFRRTADLTRQIDRDELELMGVRGGDIAVSRNDGTSSYGEIVAIEESPVTPGILWVGTDDGNLQLSQDAGETWTELSRRVGIADGTYVSRIVASRSGAGTAYVTFDAHRDGDFAPYLFRTTDFGASWTPLMSGLPSGSINSMVEHPDNADVLFVGTEHHVFASTDRGATWAQIPGIPTTAYDDLIIHPREKDLVLGTHGRGIWILDDTTPLAEWTAEAAAADLHVFSIEDATIFNYRKDTSYRAEEAWSGDNPVDGALVTYRLGSGTGSESSPVRMRVTNEAGRVVWDKAVPSEPGVHRVNWNLRHQPTGDTDEWAPHEAPLLARSLATRGPWVSPGTFTVTLQAGNATSSSKVTVRGDPMMPLTQADYEAREEFLLGLVELEAQARAHKPDLRCGGGVGGGGRARPTNLQGDDAVLCAVRREAQQVANSLNGGQVRPGSLYPPTTAQQERIAALRAQLESILGGSN
jgi:photosystem II stability/assembly factor-like uncharacterized protein